MKAKILKRVLSAACAGLLLCTASPVMASEQGEHQGKILLLSALQSGIGYDAMVEYLNALCSTMGYDLAITYGDGFNDAAGNLQAVKNFMTDDVVGIITMQDGGLLAIMEEYPELPVVGYHTDMQSVFNEDGENRAVLEREQFLGTISDGYIDGNDTAQSYFDTVVEKGFKKVAIVTFPGFAFPQMEKGAHHFVDLVNEYNETASEEDQIQIVGDIETLVFTPLEDSWFLDDGHGDLDAIVAICAGTTFVFPTMVNAIVNGLCSPDTKLVTGGFDTDDAIIDNIGDSEGKIICSVSFSPMEDIGYSMALLDNAIAGNQYDDFEAIRVDGYEYKIDSDEDIENAMTKGFVGTLDPEKAQITPATIFNTLCRRNNPDATFAQLQEIYHDPAVISVDALKD